MARRSLYIFDVDGTIADAEHRRHYVEDKKNPRWDLFFAACGQDQPIKAVISTMYLLRPFADIWFWSGRSDEVRTQTVDWISHHTSFMKHDVERMLRMRRKGDYTPDDQLKEGWLKDMLIEERQRLVAVFDDRQKVVDMWRRNGVPCFQVAEGNF